MYIYTNIKNYHDLIRREREKHKEIDWIRSKLIKAEQSGFTELTAAENLKQAKTQII